MLLKKCGLLLAALLVILNNAQARLKLPILISDGMVLQRNATVNIWGWATPGSKLQIVFMERTNAAVTNTAGKWSVKIKTGDAGGPYNMEIKGDDGNITITNILLGDVWLCGGQSNMVLDFNTDKLRTLYASEIANAKNNNIRQILVNRSYSATPQANFRSAGWKAADPKNLLSFTAAGYFFALTLFNKFHVPIGLINSSYGGTMAEAWTSEDGLKTLPQFNKGISFLKDTAAVTDTVRKTQQILNQWNKRVQTDDPGLNHTTGLALWADPNFDDNAWKLMIRPGYWDHQGYANTCGAFWFRKTIDVPQAMAGKPAMLQLGQLGDVDSTWINGELVGTTGNRDVLRKYPCVLSAGKNVIAIRIVNINLTDPLPADVMRVEGEGIYLPLNNDWKAAPGVLLPRRPGGYEPKNLPTSLFNAMIAPLLPYKLKGVIWYQGEFNAHRAYEYRTLFPSLISNWRAQFQQGNLPFIYQQLPNFQPVSAQSTENEWAELREAQLMALNQPNTAMSVAIDIGGNDLHPANKKDVGTRLALAALRLAYNQKIVASGPIYKSMRIDGDKIVLSFNTFGCPMISKGGALKYFAVAGADKKFVWADAIIKGNKIEVSAHGITNPVAVRYAWAGNPEGCNLYNDVGLPASPFRTDDWPALTINNKY